MIATTAAGFGSPEVTNWLYAGLLVVALANLVAYLIAQLRSEGAARPNLQRFDVRKAQQNNNFDKVPLRIVFSNIGSRPARVTMAYATVGDERIDAVSLSTSVVRFGELYVLELQDAMQRWVDSFKGEGKPSQGATLPVTIEYEEIDGSHKRSTSALVPFYPRTPVTQDLRLAAWVDTEDGKRPPVWDR